MIAYTVEIKNLPELQNLYRQAPEIAGKKIIEAGNKSLLSLQATAKQLSPIDSGRLRQSILVSPMQQSGNTFTGSVGTNTAYSVYQEIGTGIYGPLGRPITPKAKKVLAFVGKGGKMVFAKSVKGVRGRYYMKGSLEQNQRAIEGYFATAADDIARDLSTG